jgi:hypothetical protein
VIWHVLPCCRSLYDNPFILEPQDLYAHSSLVGYSAYGVGLSGPCSILTEIISGHRGLPQEPATMF